MLTCQNAQGLTVPRKPSEVVGILNSFVLEGVGTDHYFTIIYGHMDLDTGEVVLCQCGHPAPIVQRRDGTTLSLGSGGLPVGLFGDANWNDDHISLAKGDRLFLISDGLTELSSPAGVFLDQEGMEKIISGHHDTETRSVFDAIMWDLGEYIGNADFPDDISGLVIEIGKTPDLYKTDDKKA